MTRGGPAQGEAEKAPAGVLSGGTAPPLATGWRACGPGLAAAPTRVPTRRGRGSPRSLATSTPLTEAGPGRSLGPAWNPAALPRPARRGAHPRPTSPPAARSDPARHGPTWAPAGPSLRGHCKLSFLPEGGGRGCGHRHRAARIAGPESAATLRDAVSLSRRPRPDTRGRPDGTAGLASRRHGRRSPRAHPPERRQRPRATRDPGPRRASRRPRGKLHPDSPANPGRAPPPAIAAPRRSPHRGAAHAAQAAQAEAAAPGLRSAAWLRRRCPA